MNIPTILYGPNVTSKESYSAWVTEWKQTYKKWSGIIKETKACIKKECRLNDGGRHSAYYRDLVKLKKLATDLINLRKEGKRMVREIIQKQREQRANDVEVF